MTNLAYALARAELIRVLTAYTGITTADGLGDGTTLIDANLIGKDSQKIVEKTILIMSGDAEWEDKGASAFNTGTGKITLQGTGFSAQIKAGTIFRILNISSIEMDVANIDTKIGTNVDAAGTTTLFARLRQIVDDYLASGTTGLAALKALINAAEAKLDKLAGSEADTEIAARDLTAVGGGTSGENGADILTISTTTRKKVHMLTVSMKNCQAAATITVRMYTKVNGTFEKFYDQPFTKDTDPDAIMVINGTLAILADLRVEMHSSDALDNNVTVPYSYILEDME